MTRPDGIRPIRLDHVAVADMTTVASFGRYVADLGGTWLDGGGVVGFHADQIAFDGGHVELIVPVGVEHDDFLVRFLDRHGAGPHHLTFKTASVAAAVPVLVEAGYRVMNVRLDLPGGEEAFVHPHDAAGILVQIQQQRRETPADAPPLPASRVERRSRLLRVAMVVRSLPDALRLYGDVLGGTEVTSGAEGVDLEWEGGRVVRLVEPTAGTAEAAWLGDRPGRVLHLAFATLRPAEVPGAVPGDDGRHVVEPADNGGVRLVLTELA